MNVYLESLGCKLNQSETEAMARSLHHAGHRVVYDPMEADICIVNSCAVTHIAARKTRQALRRLTRQGTGARVISLGCYSELWPDQLQKIEGVEVLKGPAVKEDIAGLLGGPGYSRVAAELPRQRTRAFVKVQDGCNNHCTYCVVRIARGRERSRPLPEIVQEVRQLTQEGVNEIVLTGVHVGAYGLDQGLDLTDLVRTLLAEIRDLPRLRLSSIEPWHLQPRFLELWEEPRLCRHLHLPLQSGCDATLKRMGRRYTSREFASLVEVARARIPDLAVTTDVMVGFPGETEAEFRASLAFVERMAFSRLHVFRYSARPGTPAAGYPNQVPPTTSAERSEALREVGGRSGHAFRRSLLGQRLPILWETRSSDASRWEGLTDNYVRVTVSSERTLHNQIVPAWLERLEDDHIEGRLAVQEADLTLL